MEPQEALDKIDAAFRKSGMTISSNLHADKKRQAEAAWSWAIHLLAGYAIYPSSPQLSGPKYKTLGRADARKELTKLANAADALVARFGTLSKTSIESLGGSHIREPIELQCKWLRDLSEVARTVEINGARGRSHRTNQRALSVATIVVDAFETFTGHKTDVNANNFNNDRPRVLEPLIRNIFKIVGVKADAKHYQDVATMLPRVAIEHNPRPPRATLADSTEMLFEKMRRAELDKVSPKNWRRAF